MKKILLSLVCVFSCFSLMAQKPQSTTYNFSENVVFVTGIDRQTPVTSDPMTSQQQVIESRLVTLPNAFVIENFTIPGGSELNLGKVTLEGITIFTGEDGLKTISYEGTYTFDVSNLPIAVQEQARAMLTDVPVKLYGKFKGTKLYAVFSMVSEYTSGSTNHRMLVAATYGTDDFTSEPEGTVYTESLVVTINGESSEPQDADIIVSKNEDGTINFNLKNFILESGGNGMPVGNIYVENIPATVGNDGLTRFSFSDNIFIEPGDKEGYSEEDWLGPLISERDEDGNPIGIPIVLSGKLNDNKLYATIDIDMQTTLGQTIYVEIGTNYFKEAKLGDVNDDGRVDIADVVTVLNIMAAE